MAPTWVHNCIFGVSGTMSATRGPNLMLFVGKSVHFGPQKDQIGFIFSTILRSFLLMYLWGLCLKALCLILGGVFGAWLDTFLKLV